MGSPTTTAELLRPDNTSVRVAWHRGNVALGGSHFPRGWTRSSGACSSTSMREGSHRPAHAAAVTIWVAWLLGQARQTELLRELWEPTYYRRTLHMGQTWPCVGGFSGVKASSHKVNLSEISSSRCSQGSLCSDYLPVPHVSFKTQGVPILPPSQSLDFPPLPT